MIFGMGEEDLPEKQIAQLPPDAPAIIDKNYEKAMTPIEKQYGLINNIDQSPIQGDMSQAIKQKYSGLLGERLQGFKAGERINARDKQLQNIKTAQTSLLARTQIQNDAFAAQLEAQQAREAARAETLSSILGFGGMAAGIAYADSQKPKPRVTHASAVGSNSLQMGRESINQRSAPMERSASYRNDLQGIGDFGNYA
jgi:hypothetical protein